MEDSIGLPVVNGFLMVELCNSKDTTKTDCSDLCRQDFYFGHDGGYIIPIHSKIGEGKRTYFVKLVNWHGKSELIPVYLENNIFNFNLSREVGATGASSVGGAGRCLLNKDQQSGNEYGRAVCS